MLPSARHLAIEDAIRRHGGTVVDPWPYAARMDDLGIVEAFDRFATASGIRHFRGVEILTPSTDATRAAKAQGWPGGLQVPEVWSWPVGALLCLMADHVRDEAGAAVTLRNWFRCLPVNAAVAKSGPSSDHPHACGVDLDISKGGNVAAARSWVELLYDSPMGEALRVSVGYYASSPRTIHLGVFSPEGQRKWGW